MIVHFKGNACCNNYLHNKEIRSRKASTMPQQHWLNSCLMVILFHAGFKEHLIVVLLSVFYFLYSRANFTVQIVSIVVTFELTVK